MESLGPYLKRIRQQNNYTIDQIAKETHISKKYIEAIENEEFSGFPGEVYLVGFIKNYAEFLGLDTQEIVDLYNNIRLREEPIPVEQLTAPTRKNFNYMQIILIGIVIILLIGIGYYFSKKRTSNNLFTNKIKKEKQSVINANKNIKILVEKNEENITLNKGQKVLFDLFEIEHWIELSETKDWIRISMSNNQEIPLIQGHERKVDFNNDNLPDFLIILNSFYNNEANLTFKKLEKSSDEKYINIENEKLSEIIEKSEDKNIIINEVKYRAFEISFEFRSECLMRIQWDDEAEEQKLYAKGDVKIVRVANYLRIWASNAGSIKAEIIDFNKELKLGTFGEVISKLVRWQKAQTQGTYSIILANIK